MTKGQIITLSVCTLLIGVITYFYSANPFHTATLDPRGRIFGHVLYSIPSESMSPTLMPGDVIVTKTQVYASSEPQLQDVVVFQYPDEPYTPYVMRIAGVGGDRIKLEQGVLYVNGEQIYEPYVLPENNDLYYSKDFSELTVPDGHFYVLGDNRGNSRDSRYWGFLPRENMIGRAHFIYYANDIDRIGRIEHSSSTASIDHDALVTDCDERLIGQWTGERSTGLGTISWLAAMKPDHDLIIDFKEIESDRVRGYKHIGTWECNAGILYTSATDEEGQEYNLKYRILELTQNIFRYRNFDEQGVGITFESHKINNENQIRGSISGGEYSE